MAVSIADADSYISQNVIDTEDWADADEAKKQRMLNEIEQDTACLQDPVHLLKDRLQMDCIMESVLAHDHIEGPVWKIGLL